LILWVDGELGLLQLMLWTVQLDYTTNLVVS